MSYWPQKKFTMYLIGRRTTRDFTDKWEYRRHWTLFATMFLESPIRYSKYIIWKKTHSTTDALLTSPPGRYPGFRLMPNHFHLYSNKPPMPAFHVLSPNFVTVTANISISNTIGSGLIPRPI